MFVSDWSDKASTLTQTVEFGWEIFRRKLLSDFRSSWSVEIMSDKVLGLVEHEKTR